MADIVLTDAAGQPHDARRGDALLQRVGNWTSSLVMAELLPAPPTGAVTLSYHGLSLSGYVVRSGTSADGTTEVVVAGGAGGLWSALPPRMYDNQVSVRLVLTEPGGILPTAGESLSPASSTDALDLSLPQWPRLAGEAGYLIDDLAREAGVVWRVLSDGTVFFGSDDFLPVLYQRQNAAGVATGRSAPVPDQDFTLQHTDTRHLRQRFAPLTPFQVRPGDALSFAGQSLPSPRVSTVLHRDDGEHYHADVWYLDPSAGQAADDELTAGFRSIVREELRATSTHPVFHGRVVAQRGNGRLDIEMDDASLPPLTNCQYSVAVPGATMTVAGGTMVQVCFVGGDPKLPVALLMDPGTGNRAIGATGDEVDSGAIVQTSVPNPMTSGTDVVWTYTDAFGHSATQKISFDSSNQFSSASGGTFTLKGKLTGTCTLKVP